MVLGPINGAGWRGSLRIAPLNAIEMLMGWSRQLGQVAGTVIEAPQLTLLLEIYTGQEPG